MSIALRNFAEMYVIETLEFFVNSIESTRLHINRMFAINRSCKYFGCGGFPGSAGTAKQICMGDPAGYNLIPECTDDGVLANNMGKILGPPLTVKRTVSHLSFHILLSTNQSYP